MPVVSSFIAKMLALLDRVLFYFVYYVPLPGNPNTESCGIMNEATQGNTWLTPCGEGFLRNTFALWHLIDAVFRPLETALLILKGLFVVN